MAEFTVNRSHFGDRNYSKGDTRTAEPRDVAHLVRSGVLTEKAAPTAKNKAATKATNKAVKK